jgi:hypothetical protein
MAANRVAGGRRARVSHEAKALTGLNGWSSVALATVTVLISGLTIVLAPSAAVAITLGAAAYLLVALASIKEPLLYVTVFLGGLIALPPVYLERPGAVPIYPTTLLLPIGAGIVVCRLPDFKLRFDPVAGAFTCFLLFTGISLPFVWIFSGSHVGWDSLLRWLMLAQVILIYAIVQGGMRAKETRLETRLMPALFAAAAASAIYGVIDFVWPIPIPHPAADQFIWLGSGIIRRAQGVFFEASSFANMCGFFLAAAAAAFLTGKERAVRLSKAWLLALIAVLTLAVFVSFSRSAWGCVLTTILVFAALFGRVRAGRLAWFLFALCLPLFLLPLYSPELWNYFLINRVGHFTQIFADPNLVSSGRIDTWRRIAGVLQEHPHYFIFGVGYKSLPRTRLFHQPIITDNGFLNLLLETGIAGLFSFVLFLSVTFRTFWRLAHSLSIKTAFWGGLLFSFWCGECVQLMAADAYTYWRNMAVFLALMGIVMNWAEREQAGG